MQLPVVAYGHPVLRTEAMWVDTAHPDLPGLIGALWTTMYGANGCGLAASQVNVAIKLFIVDSTGTYEQMEADERALYFDGDQGIQETFINAEILHRSERQWADEEGCLSIPGISGKVTRPWSITLSYQDHEGKRHTRDFHGITARMIQHEYDHTRGVLYLDRLGSTEKARLKHRLKKIFEGKVKAPYPMYFSKNHKTHK